jgi:UDP-2-acetamido-2,6-beta-L-arabino-hexul-4-ose reductase
MSMPPQELSCQRVVGVTGPRGFIAGHLIRRLSLDANMQALRISREELMQPDALVALVGRCDTIVHLAAVNRGEDRELYEMNLELVERLIRALETAGKRSHVVFASSTQRERSTAYGRSKKHGEDRLRDWARRTGNYLTVLVIPNVFGPGCRPNFNSVVATFCHQLAHGHQPVVAEDRQIEFAWVHDVVESIVQAIAEAPSGAHELRVSGTARLTVSQLLAKLQAICDAYFEQNVVPDLAEQLDARLYATFLSHVELDDHRHRPQVHADARGQLCEILRMSGGGQVFFSTTRPGAVRGNHFHSRKVEWFCVLRGEAAIRIRPVGSAAVREFRVSGSLPEFISIPPMHAHQIENIGDDELLTMFWCNEIFQPADPDTFYEQVA